jgi:hypothetical protein
MTDNVHVLSEDDLNLVSGEFGTIRGRTLTIK